MASIIEKLSSIVCTMAENSDQLSIETTFMNDRSNGPVIKLRASETTLKAITDVCQKYGVEVTESGIFCELAAQLSEHSTREEVQAAMEALLAKLKPVEEIMSRYKNPIKALLLHKMVTCPTQFSADIIHQNITLPNYVGNILARDLEEEERKLLEKILILGQAAIIIRSVIQSAQLEFNEESQTSSRSPKEQSRQGEAEISERVL